MACGATLKRHHEFDPLHQSPGCSPKRMCLDNPTNSPNASRCSTLHTPKYSHPIGCSSSANNIHRSPSSAMHIKRPLYHAPFTSAIFNSSSFIFADPLLKNNTSTVRVSEMEEHRGNLSDDMVAIFSLKQVDAICKNILREQESNVRQHFDRVLSDKLAEQYESFVRFNEEHLRKRFCNSIASYVS